MASSQPVFRVNVFPSPQVLSLAIDVFQVIILIGNKADLEAQRDVTYEEAKQFAEENGEQPVRENIQIDFRTRTSH